MPGSNPLFGLNTLGGAISIDTKNGYSQPGTTIQLSGGSFGRRAGEFEHGGSNSKGLSWYVAGNLFREDGWRQFSPSEVRQSFAKLGWQHGKTSIYLSGAYADNWLTGNGLQDTRFLAQNYSSVYSIPDITWNRSPSLNLSLRHDATSNLTFSGNAYFRYIRADTTNGDINSNSFDESLYNLNAADIAALTAAGYKGFPTTGNATTQPFPFWRCIAQGLEHNEPIEKCTGLITNTFNKQHNYGLSGQVSWLVAHNRITAGAAWDRSSTIFQQGSQFGYLNPDHLTITPINAFADGSTNSERRSGGYAGQSSRAHQHLQPVRVRYALGGQIAGVHGFGPLQPDVDRQYRSSASGDGRIARLAQRSICFRSLQSGRRASPTSLRDSPRRISATAKRAARRRPSNWVVPIPTSPATFPTPWSAIRRSNRWSPGLSKPACAGRLENNLRWNVGLVPGRKLQRSSVRGIPADRFRLFHQLRPDAPSRSRNRTSAAGSSISRSGAITRFWTPPIKVRRRLTAAAIAPMMEVWEWMATSRCSPATAFRRFPRNIFKAYARVPAHCENLGGSRLRCGGALLRARQ